jgi:hypothetical protein
MGQLLYAASGDLILKKAKMALLQKKMKLSSEREIYGSLSPS